MAEVDYPGSRGTNLIGVAFGCSQDELLGKGHSMGSTLLNPTSLNGTPMTVGQSLRPYPFCSDVSDRGSYVIIFPKQNGQKLQSQRLSWMVRPRLASQRAADSEKSVR